jgi:hypothetical protein
MEHCRNDTDRGEWSTVGMILTEESGAFQNDTDRGEWNIAGMILTGESGALSE